jgi:mono/diheme cytochrome c family protein
MKRLLALTIIVVLGVGIAAWYCLYRDVPQPAWISADPRDDFLYGSVGAERTAGLPYWVWLALPRICPQYLPGPGGYAALGRPWEEGKEMPAGFAKKTVGYVRVAGNCALCHAVNSRPGPNEIPLPVIAPPGQAADVQPLLTFLARCAQDPHFNASDILSEIDMATKLSIPDRLLYHYVLIPRARQALLERSALVASAFRLHSQHPDAPFREPRTKALAAWLQEQRRATR